MQTGVSTRKRGQIPPRRQRYVTMPRGGYRLPYGRDHDRNGVLYVIAVRARGWRIIHDEASEREILADRETWQAQLAEARRLSDRRLDAALRVWLKLMASWTTPALPVLYEVVGPVPLVSQLVDDLAVAPCAPPADDVVVGLLAA